MKSSHKKMCSVVVALFLAVMFVGTAQAAPAASTVGYVDFAYLVNQHPDAAAANAQFKTLQDQTNQDFTET